MAGNRMGIWDSKRETNRDGQRESQNVKLVDVEIRYQLYGIFFN